MTSPEKMNALEVEAAKQVHNGAIETVSPIQFQEKEVTMTSIVGESRKIDQFDPEIHVGNMTVFPADDVVWTLTPNGALSMTPEQACALAAALQAVAVHVMEQRIEVA